MYIMLQRAGHKKTYLIRFEASVIPRPINWALNLRAIKANPYNNLMK